MPCVGRCQGFVAYGDMVQETYGKAAVDFADAEFKGFTWVASVWEKNVGAEVALMAFERVHEAGVRGFIHPLIYLSASNPKNRLDINRKIYVWRAHPQQLLCLRRKRHPHRKACLLIFPPPLDNIIQRQNQRLMKPLQVHNKLPRQQRRKRVQTFGLRRDRSIGTDVVGESRVDDFFFMETGGRVEMVGVDRSLGGFGR